LISGELGGERIEEVLGSILSNGWEPIFLEDRAEGQRSWYSDCTVHCSPFAAEYYRGVLAEVRAVLAEVRKRPEFDGK